MKVILTMAISANGVIATKDGSEDFLSHDNWIQFAKLANRVGCFIWGRKTYEAVIKWEGDHLEDLKDVQKIVVSRSEIDLEDGFTLAKSPEDALKQPEEKGFKEAIITGGATLNTEFAKLGLIDEVVFDVNPSIVGNGIPVFSKGDFMLNLEFVDMSKVSKDIYEVKYKVKK